MVKLLHRILDDRAVIYKLQNPNFRYEFQKNVDTNYGRNVNIYYYGNSTIIIRSSEICVLSRMSYKLDKCEINENSNGIKHSIKERDSVINVGQTIYNVQILNLEEKEKVIEFIIYLTDLVN